MVNEAAIDEPGPLPAGTVIFPTKRPSMLGEPAELALSRTPDGELVAVGFTDLHRLVAAFGPEQPWLAFDGHDIPLLLEGSGITQVLLDAAIDYLAS